MNSLELLQAYYRGEHLEFTGDVKEEIRKHNKQSLSPFLYFVYGKPFIKAYIGSTMIQERFYKLQDEITSLFNENKIKHYYIKGSVLSKIYPDPALRTRGDIDVVVQECDYDRARKVLENNGYKFEEEADHNISFIINGLNVELHRRLLPKKDAFYNYFKDGFNHANLVKDYLYELDHNFHYLFLVAHLNKHLITGEGLRSLLDFYYMDKKYELNYNYIKLELEKISLLKLFQNICNCLYVITGEKLDGYTGKNVDTLLSFMLDNGIHGRDGLDSLYEKGVIMNNGKLKYLLKKLFINKEERKYLYPKMSKCFLCYPLIIVHRFFKLLFTSSNKLKATLKIDMDKCNIEHNFFEDYGIKNSE